MTLLPTNLATSLEIGGLPPAASAPAEPAPSQAPVQAAVAPTSGQAANGDAPASNDG